MPQALTQKQVAQLQECLDQAQEVNQHDRANQIFSELRATLPQDAATVEVLNALWKEVLAARRSAIFWQELSDVEKDLSDRLAENHVQLHRNYLRLMQEQ
jgi:hypothetical protein